MGDAAAQFRQFCGLAVGSVCDVASRELERGEDGVGDEMKYKSHYDAVHHQMQPWVGCLVMCDEVLQS